MATLLRAEGAAILSLEGRDVRTLFSSRTDGSIPWDALIAEDLMQRAVGSREGFTTALPADRWDDSVSYALIAPVEAGPDRGALCAVRHQFPFDAVDVSAADAAAQLLRDAFEEAPREAPRERTPVAPERSPRAPLPVRDALALRAAVIEDHPATRIGLEALLAAAGVDVVVSAATLGEASARLGATRADVALVDLTLPDAPGADAIERLRGAAPGIAIVTFGDERAVEILRLALRAGAVGHLGKDASPARIVAALRAAGYGLAALDVAALDALLGVPAPAAAVALEVAGLPERPTPGATPREPLSPRELELLRHLAEGYTNKEIARAMVLAEDTVKKGVQSVIAKLGAADRTHAVVLALRGGLID